MPGYIDNSSDQALYEGYNQGRAFTGAQVAGDFAQWSAVNDDRTCDWCSWADLRVFNTNEEPWDPPVHWGCKCLIAYILENEIRGWEQQQGIEPITDWGSGPPQSAFPPGSTNRTTSAGKPTLAREGKLPKPSKFDQKKLGNFERRFKELIDEGDLKMDAAPDGSKYLGRRRSTRSTRVANEAVEDLLGADFDGYLHDSYREVWRAWAGETPKIAKEFVGLLDRGSVDDMIEWWVGKMRSGQRPDLLNWLPRDVFKQLSDQNRTYIASVFQHHEATKAVAQSAMRTSGMLDVDGYVTLYRGVPVHRPTGTIRTWWDSFRAGDAEFAIGTTYAESWSANIEKAWQFAGRRAKKVDSIVFTKKVHVDDVLSHYMTESGYLSGESEVLWGNIDGTLVPKALKFDKVTNTMEVELW